MWKDYRAPRSGIVSLDLVMALFLVSILSNVFATWILSAILEKKILENQIIQYKLQAHLQMIADDIDRHRYDLIPVAKQNYTYKNIVLKSGIFYFRLNPTVYLKVKKTTNDMIYACQNAEFTEQTDLFLQVSASGFAILKSAGKINLSYPLCQWIRFEVFSNPLLENSASKNSAVLLHPILKKYLLYVSENNALKLASFDGLGIIENHTIQENFSVGYFRVVELDDIKAYRIEFKGDSHSTSVINSIPRRQLMELLFDPFL
ncbi:MAG: hypothetical protein NZO16_03335 [Deltaproteobacteria bacterium]|nr:hypothetical protein [Deltaproteobacteria bacterium]